MSVRSTRWAQRFLVGVLILIPSAIAFTFLAVEASSQPQFCGSCHIMEPYYRSWTNSSHRNIACVECHIPPGLQSEFRKKYEALSMVTRYFTGTYSTNPWTEVDDKSCLRSGCHTTRVLLGKELFHGVQFDHQPHLTELRRNKQLRCTSCHSQIVQGSHITVTPSTCFLCHFKGVPLNEGTARCTLCHAVPEKTVTTAGLSFNHADVKRFGMDCVACHEGVVKGDGEVPRERCFTCHNDAPRLNRYGETEFLHRTHVTEHKVECLHCHIEISHKIPAREATTSTSCQSCHSDAAGHAAVRDLYRGIGAKGVAPQPAAMYLAGVRCEACHNRQRGEHRVANEVSCMACHGPTYLTIYRSWQAGLQRRIDGMQQELQTATARLELHDHTAADALQDAQHNLAMLEGGRAIHNPSYAIDMLQQAHRTVLTALAAAGAPAATDRPPWVEAPYAAECLRCHFGIETLSAAAFGTEFPHQPHVVNAHLRCTVCHGDSAQHGTLRLDAADCADCHERITRPMTDVSAEQCLRCHTAQLGRLSGTARFPHEKHIDAGLDCGTCHAGVTEKAHRAFAHSAQARPSVGHPFCGTCHAGDVLATDGSMPDGANCGLCHEQT